MDEIIEVQDQFYILATSSRVDEQTRVLKHGDTFAVFDRYGNIQQIGLGEQGLYHEGTRFLSRLEFRLLGRRPLLLSSTVTEDNAQLTVDVTNPDIWLDGQMALARDQVHGILSCFLWNGVCYQRLRLRNYSLSSVDVTVEWRFDADFKDIFEVRGLKRERRGELRQPIVSSDCVRLCYQGLDHVQRHTTLHFEPAPQSLSESSAKFHDTLPPGGEKDFDVTVNCDPPNTACPLKCFDAANLKSDEELQAARKRETTISTSNEQFNAWLNRSAVDLHLMMTEMPQGPYPYAGVPWFSTPFGRDGLITALELLWINPELARGVLSFLAANQAETSDQSQDAEPGKILHETRRGEMAALGEIPFGRYYGSVDATPLFVMLAGAYFERTDDEEFAHTLWPHVEAALKWIERSGDVDGDGFIEYSRRSEKGLVVQGWKDSMDSVFHADGTLAEGPVALCEVQGYVFAALLSAARLARVTNRLETADRLVEQAERLRCRFEESFWCDEIGTYALALDGRKRPCKVRTSNPGHCLFTGIASIGHAARVAATLLDDDSFSGWGVRTVASGEARYNPMSYHNGSIWPHDNAILVAGLARYGLTQPLVKLVEALFDASINMDLHRMPELFCGFRRRSGEGPTLYPVACAPQSWSAAVVFSLIQSALGLTIDAPHGQIRLVHSVLPKSLQRVSIQNLEVAGAKVDLALERYPVDVGVELLSRSGEVEILIVK